MHNYLLVRLVWDYHCKPLNPHSILEIIVRIVDFVVGSVQQFEVYMRQQELFVVQIVVGRNGTLMFGNNMHT